MKMLKQFSKILLSLLIVGCSGSKTEKFPMDKPYWNAEDYNEVIRTLQFNTNPGDRYPTLDDPETAPVFNKLIDQQNISVVVDDNALGLRYRSEFTSNMFREYQTLIDLYQVMDREDKFVYDRELVEILKFGLYLQIRYFKVGNDKIIQEADNLDQVKSIIRSNEQTLISNFNIYLDYTNKERSFSEESLELYATALNEYFPMLMETFPEASYRTTLTKAIDMEKKSTNSVVKKSLADLISKIENKIGVVETADSPAH